MPDPTIQNPDAIIAALWSRLRVTAQECDVVDGVTTMVLTDAVLHLAQKHGYDVVEVKVLLKWRAGEVSEGEAADKLGVDRLEARTMLEPLTRRAPRKVREEHSESTETKTE
jgi:hypothetical protein